MTTATIHDTTEEQPPLSEEVSSTVLALRWIDHIGDSHEASIDETPLTIGSGPKCAVRLQQPDVHPMHCVVRLVDGVPVVRRWADGALINQSDFSEQELYEGDQLEIAGVSLFVVATTVEASVEKPLQENWPQAASEDNSADETSAEELTPAQPDLAPVVERLRKRAQANRERTKRLLEELRRTRLAINESFDAAETVTEQSLESTVVEEVAEELPSCESPQYEDAEFTECVEDSAEPFACQVEEEPEATHEAAEPQVVFETGEENQESPSFYEQYAHLLPTDEQEEPSVASAEVDRFYQEPPADTPELQTRETQAKDAEDESLDTYMQEFMRRLRTNNQAQPDVSLESLAEECNESKEEAHQDGEGIDSSNETPPKRPEPAPETSDDIAALRSLANESARSAILTSDVNRQKESELIQLSLTLAGLLLSLLVCFTSTTFLGGQFLCGVLGTVGSLVFGAQVINEGVLWAKKQIDLEVNEGDAEVDPPTFTDVESE